MRFFEKAAVKDVANVVSMIQLLQFVVTEQVIGLFSPNSFKCVTSTVH